MFRKTLTIFSLVGLILSMGLWVASYWIVALTIRRPSSIAIVFATRGLVGADLGPQSNRNPRVEWTIRDFQGLGTSFTWGFWHQYGSTAILIPLYAPTLVFGASFTYLGLPWFRHRKRRKFRLCLECGYDLRGSKERCPECGRETGALGAPLLITEE